MASLPGHSTLSRPPAKLVIHMQSRSLAHIHSGEVETTGNHSSPHLRPGMQLIVIPSSPSEVCADLYTHTCTTNMG